MLCFLSHQVGGFLGAGALGAGAGAVLLETAGSYAAFWPAMIAAGIAAASVNGKARPSVRAIA